MSRSILVATAALIVAPGAVLAQGVGGSLAGAADARSNFSRDRNVSVRSRPHPEYEAIGLRTGAFMVFPKLGASVEANDNVFATPGDKRDDVIGRFTPEVSVNSLWSRHALSGYARAVVNRYADLSTENTDDYAAGLQGRLDVLRAAQINLTADWSRLTEPRTSATSEGQARPVQYEVTSANLTAMREFNRLRLSGRLEARNFIYLARPANRPQDDRDRLQTTATLRADYALSPDTAFFVQVAGNRRAYRLENPPPAAFPDFVDRDSQGVEALVGANFEVSNLARGEIGFGYLRQTFDRPDFAPVKSLGARAQVEWFPTQLMTVTVTGARSVEEAGVLGASSMISSNVGAQVDYELLRNLILSGQVGYGEDDYQGAPRLDKRTSAGLSATYLLNRHAGVTVAYSRQEQTSHGAARGEDFKVNKIGATLTLKY
ncbi:outer membrane beta-barrel protein [Phenylobacterium sp.]|uniref:outer membrane beta-barrel protein n=1 Tax=Phenylobacterium sp. TaxID=1871053 RepID=UPI00391AB1A1